MTVEERFWEKVDRHGPDECWPWTGSRKPKGYGDFWDGTRLVVASRFAWSTVNGPVPPGLHVLHSCDNPPCCNPRHLHTGTQARNSAEMVERGRRKGPAKLSPAKVASIRALLGGGMFQREIAARFRIDQAQVSRIANEKAWA